MFPILAKEIAVLLNFIAKKTIIRHGVINTEIISNSIFLFIEMMQTMLLYLVTMKT